MSFLRPICAAQPRSRRSVRFFLEDLETRLALAATPFAPGAGVGAPSVVVQPTFQRVPLSSIDLAMTGVGGVGVQPQGFGTSTPTGYEPAQIRAAYGIDSIDFASIPGDGTGQTIAIVDAFDDPGFVDTGAPGFLTSDLAEFDHTFGLPNPPSFIKLNEYGSSADLPQTDPAGAGNPLGNWEIEEALDVEWAHAIAPGASIILVEANSANGSDMDQAVITAAEQPGVSVVSMSWGSGEFAGEQYLDADFLTPSNHQGVTFVAATGDDGSPGEYPAYSPNVVAAGGTSLYLNSNGSYNSETGWSGSGGGVSQYETEPAFQDSVQDTGARTIPDVSFDADPDTGVAIYDSYNGTSAHPWEEVGGTSVAAPVWSALFAIANQGRVDSGGTTLGGAQALSALYSIPYGDFNDVTSGSNGGDNQYNAGPGYDVVTGLGTPKANVLVPDLASYGLAAKLVLSTQPPADVTAGSSFALQVQVDDAKGQLATSFDGSVTLALASDPGGASLGGNLTVMAQSGIATFSGLTLDRTGAGYILLVTAEGSTATTTNSFNVTPAAPTRLVIISEPPFRVGVNEPFGLTVAVEDSFGNLETGAEGTVTVALAGGSGEGGLGGTVTVLVQNGVATFSNITLSRSKSGYSLKANGGDGLAPAKTTPFHVISTSKKSAKKEVLLVRIGSSLVAHPRSRRIKGHARA